MAVCLGSVRRVTIASIVGVAALCSTAAVAADFVWVSDDRSSYSWERRVPPDPEFTQITESTATPPVPFASWSSGLQSTITPSTITGRGFGEWASILGPVDIDRRQRQIFDMTFQVDRPATYELEASPVFLNAEVQLLVLDAVVGGGDQGIFTGILSPGVAYRLFSDSDFNRGFDFSFSITEVPEPGTGLLVGLGASLLAAGRRGGGRPARRP